MSSTNSQVAQQKVRMYIENKREQNVKGVWGSWITLRRGGRSMDKVVGGPKWTEATEAATLRCWDERWSR